MSDEKHNCRTEPRGKKFDFNYLYYLYCKWCEEWFLDSAREYLYDNISQIVQTAKPRSINVPKNLHVDLDTEMFMLVDKLCVWLFTDDRIVKIKDLDWSERKWTRFEKYFYPNQAYWYIRFTVNKKIIDYFNRIRLDNSIHSMPDADLVDWWSPHEETNRDMSSHIIIREVLRQMIELDEIDKFIFLSVKLNWKSIKSVKDDLEYLWIEMSQFKIKKSAMLTLQKIKDNVDDLHLEEYH